MTNTHQILASLDDLKAQAKRLRTSLTDAGTIVSHSKSLELLAAQLGYRDWNTLHAAAGNGPPPNPLALPAQLALGAKVQGTYLSQPFEGEVIGVQALSQGRIRVTLDFDEPVDVVTFDSFSAYRRRVSVTVGTNGQTTERTSNGEPQLKLQVR